MAAISFVGRIYSIEFKQTNGGTAIATLKVPVDTGWGERKVTTWYVTTAFGKLAERLESTHHKGYLDAGTNVFVRGSFALREYEGKSGKGYSPDVTADDVQIVFAPRDAGSNPSGGGNDHSSGVPF